MRRPVLPLFFAQALGILAACYTEVRLWQLCLIGGAAAFVLFLRSRPQTLDDRRIRAAAAAALAFLIGFTGLRACDAALTARAEALGTGLSGGPYPVLTGVVVKAEVKPGRAVLTVRLSGKDGRVLIRSETEDEFGVYDLAGREIAVQAKVTQFEIALPKGIYIVRFGKSGKKVVVW